ncbi:hypothetical protein FAM09_05055 [Niastella caeni]|uniref:Peptidase M56 domain-containing protein n=1 Tax=Niastella caeni TaxID=2569763 RepID=A0A4S8I036_9BACT|nr:M56 family metallopeptidase [Niastella caeni]THU41478.1 hypothetical protein FAM09_05055 [Niastella caeni]
MNSHTLLLFVLKSTFISGIFVGYYWMALRNKNFNNYNRFYLLLSMVCSLIVPLFDLNWFTIEKQALPVPTETFNFIPAQTTNSNNISLSWQNITFFILSTVSLFLLALLALNVFKVYQLKRRSTITKMEGVNFINTNLEHAPFSFLNNLFWKEAIPLDEDYGRKIFKHELTHIHQKHTFDILFCQIIHALFWMNPFNWFIQKELKAIHEFIADKEAVGNNNVEEFVTLLLQAHYGNHFLNPTHTFYYSSIKRRLFMLTSTNKVKFTYLRKLLLLPITLLVVVAMSISTIESKATVVVAPPAEPLKENSPSHIQQPEKPVLKNDTTPAPAKAKEQPNIIRITDGNRKANPKSDTIVIRSTANPNSKIPENVLYFINGQSATHQEVSKLRPDQIKAIDVLKGDDAIKIYGAAGAHGVINITLK